jgi:hypothetical protein
MQLILPELNGSGDIVVRSHLEILETIGRSAMLAVVLCMGLCINFKDHRIDISDSTIGR